MNSAQETDTPKLKTTHLFGEFLVSKGILTRLQLGKALDEQRRYGGRLGEAAFLSSREACALAATIHEKSQTITDLHLTQWPQTIVEMATPTSGAMRGQRGVLRSGPRSLGDESGLDVTTTPVSTIINTSRLRRRHHAGPCRLAASIAARVGRYEC